MQGFETDWTLFFRGLMEVDPENPDVSLLDDAFYHPPAAADLEIIQAWLDSWAHGVLMDGADDDLRIQRMSAANPWFIPRNYLVFQAIEAAEKGDMALLDDLFDAARTPYDVQEGREHLAARRPEWARQQPGASMLSCSS
jgi:uncharacterized protein YdiU (UPF0061 family)